MQFIDEVKVHVRAGDGGDGCIAFRREKFIPRGGPSGGDGGNGGSIIFLADPQLGTLLDLRYHQHYLGQRGEHGMGRDSYGKAGEDSVIHVPVGTVIKDAASGEVLCDLTVAGQRWVAAKGGKGGRGNMHFATSTNQAPRTAEPGGVAEERTLRLELKLLADAGLLGYPNVGKSTFIARVSHARPKIANYPFTTLVPHLGVVELKGSRSFVLADIPGLIEGAADGKGLGLRFLRHVERTRVLLHLVEVPLVPGEGRDPLADFDAINHELRTYDPKLAERPQIVAVTKLDLSETREALPSLVAQFAARGVELHALSAVTGEGVGQLLEKLWSALQKQPAGPA